jgi:hypothetical protein
MAAAAIVVTLDASAQAGIKFGYLSQGTKQVDEKVTERPKDQTGFYVGFFRDIETPIPGLAIRPGLFYSYAKGNSLFADDFAAKFDMPANIVREESHTINIPLDLKFALNFSDDFKVYAFAGPRLELGAFHIATAKENGYNQSWDLYCGRLRGKDPNGNKVSEKWDEGDRLSRFDLQMGAGLGVQYKKMMVELGYDWGLMNRVKEAYLAEDTTIRRSRFVMGVGFMF